MEVTFDESEQFKEINILIKKYSNRFFDPYQVKGLTLIDINDEYEPKNAIFNVDDTDKIILGNVEEFKDTTIKFMPMLLFDKCCSKIREEIMANDFRNKYSCKYIAGYTKDGKPVKTLKEWNKYID